MDGDANVQNKNNDTPLHYAFRSFELDDGGAIKILTYLVSQENVNVNIKGRYCYSLLHLACIINLSGSRRSVALNAECDTVLCQIVELIVERCIGQVLDETTTP
jgi:hypothetical protein